MMDYDKLLELASKWKKEAMERVPEEYASRDLHRKYLNCDNYAGGLNDCADELLELLERAAQLQRAADASAATEACPDYRHDYYHKMFPLCQYCPYCGRIS